ncbi:uncharacterized protein LOC131624383 [Vicia villosa]|uniref:uncharacterized protein LOC131624383 n=1 Tax=Vicia villosa TaxID=3911 RepID=UPI00273B2935|nr:uncharacterized protein LOC131624383 [Vicia villosa]
MKVFVEFIKDNKLIDVQCKGKTFSWFSGDGKAMSRLDRFLISDSVISRYDLEIEEGISGINEANFLLASCKENLVPEVVARRSEATSRMWKFMKIKENILLQKSRVRWDSEGDLNSHYFHSCLKERRRRNFIDGAVSESGTPESVEKVKERVRGYFAEKFVEKVRERPGFAVGTFKVMSREDSRMLESPFTEDEIKGAVWGCEGKRCLGPDGYTFTFIRKCWGFMKEDFYKFFHDFHSSARLSEAIVSSFITLIPKKDIPLGLQDYRHICLVGCLYKALAKLLASRLKKVLGDIISSSQSAFIPGRNLLDRVLVANEAVDYAKKANKSFLLFKVDLEKAYDNDCWDYLRYIVSGMNASIIGDYKGFLVGKDCVVNLLQYVDDTLLLGQGNWRQVWAFKAVLRGFEVTSGLGVNFHKSRLIGINLSEHFIGAAANFLTCKIEKSSFSFLGLPIGCNPRRIDTWKPLIGKLKARLDNWKSRFLSFGGRITLIKSILSSLFIFLLSFYKAPVSIYKEIRRIQANFLWGDKVSKKKIHWVGWDKVCTPLDRGGLGVRKIEEFNDALLLKWKWRIIQGGHSL